MDPSAGGFGGGFRGRGRGRGRGNYGGGDNYGDGGGYRGRGFSSNYRGRGRGNFGSGDNFGGGYGGEDQQQQQQQQSQQYQGSSFGDYGDSSRGRGSSNFRGFSSNYRGRGRGRGYGGDPMGMQQQQDDSKNDLFELPTAGPTSSENVLIPQNQNSFFQPGTQQIAGQLISQYLSKFQTNRDSLLDAYDKNATLSITSVHGGEVPYRSQSTDSDTSQDSGIFAAMKDHQRGVWEKKSRKFVSSRPDDRSVNEHRNKQLLYSGKYSILAELEKLPKITIDKDVKVDCVIVGQATLMISIHGTMTMMLRDVGKTDFVFSPEFFAYPDTPVKYAFDRTLVFEKPSDPSPEWPFKIISDMFHVRPAMKFHENTQKYQQPKPDAFAALASSQPQQTQPARQPLPHPQQEMEFKQLESSGTLNPQQLKMIYDVSGFTKMKVAQAQNLLNVCEWNIEKAANLYKESQGKLGSDMFYQ